METQFHIFNISLLTFGPITASRQKINVQLLFACNQNQNKELKEAKKLHIETLLVF